MKLMSLVRIVCAICLVAGATGALAQTWAIAQSKNAAGDRAIIYRYQQQFAKGHRRAALPTRVVVVWLYEGSNGMPVKADQLRMERMEDLLQAAFERTGGATLVLVSTGEDRREWTYYARSEDVFFSHLNRALGREPRFPIEIHAGEDPTWSTYDHFRTLVKE